MSVVRGIGDVSMHGASPDDRYPVVRIGPDLLARAASRLIGETDSDPLRAGGRFLESARALKIDLSLMWGTINPGTGDIRQVGLAVAGAGRTAMLFLSSTSIRPEKGWAATGRRVGGGHREFSEDLAERVAILERMCEFLSTPGPHAPRGIRLVQALLDPREKDAAAALRAAGFLQLGDLAYLRRVLPAGTPPADLAGVAAEPWPDGLNVVSVAEALAAGDPVEDVDARVTTALDRSYIDTKDCPELCGTRELSDVLESHKSVGVFDPSLWWVISDAVGPQGCMLFSVCPDHELIELVYLGLSPALRGRGLGTRLVRFGLSRLFDSALSRQPVAGHPHVNGRGGATCAVDTRNAAAMRLYRRAGFQRFAVRVPLIRALGGAPRGAP